MFQENKDNPRSIHKPLVTTPEDAHPMRSDVLNSAIIAHDFSETLYENLDLQECIKILQHKVHKVHHGDSSCTETMLLAQAVALDTIFAAMAHRAHNNRSSYGAMEGYMKLALKAQNQSRVTLEALANLKNPSLVVAKQANITNGLQQINNM